MSALWKVGDKEATQDTDRFCARRVVIIQQPSATSWEKQGDVKLKGPVLYCFSSISHSYQRSNNSVFDMYCPKPIHGPEFQLSKSCSSELYRKQAVSVSAPLNIRFTSRWAAEPMQDLFLGVDRLREDQFIYVESDFLMS